MLGNFKRGLRKSFELMSKLTPNLGRGLETLNADSQSKMNAKKFLSIHNLSEQFSVKSGESGNVVFSLNDNKIYSRIEIKKNGTFDMEIKLKTKKQSNSWKDLNIDKGYLPYNGYITIAD